MPGMGTYMWPYYYKRFGDLKKNANFERCLASMLGYKHILQLNPDPPRIRQEFEQGAPTYPRLFGILLRHYAEQQGKPRWGDQAVLLERYSDTIVRAYPEAKILHMIRDPRDRYHAARARGTSSLPQIGEATARWLFSAKIVLRNIHRYPDQYALVRYEDLVRYPEDTLRKICTFLGEEYEPEMLTMDAAPAYRKKLETGSSTSAGPLDPSFIGRYRDQLSPLEIRFIQDTAGPKMSTLNYHPHDFQRGEINRHSHAKILIMGIYQRARMKGWQIQEKLRAQWPATFGRSPEKGKQLNQPGDQTYGKRVT